MKLITNGHWLNTILEKNNKAISGIVKIKIKVLGKKYIIKLFGKHQKNIPYGVYAQIEIKYLIVKNFNFEYRTIKYNDVLITKNENIYGLYLL